MDKQLTEWFIERLTGSKDSVIDWRCISNSDKGIAAHNKCGTITELWDELVAYNQKGWGISCNINELDGQGRNLTNVVGIRAHFVDLDNTFTSHAMYEKALSEGACIAVQTSPNKYHVYWMVEPYCDNERFTVLQKKLIQAYDGDKQITDSTRVMRVPGFMHCKGEPTLVTGWDLPAVANRYTVESMEQGYRHINIIEHFGSRKPLGDPDLAATSLEWLLFAINLVDPNDMSREEWLSFTAAFKQAGWTFADDATLYNHWSKWCGQYDGDDNGENLKLWKSITDTEVGWNTIRSRTTIKAYESFAGKDNIKPPVAAKVAEPVKIAEQFGEILSADECQDYFKDCHFVTCMSRIVDRNGRFMNPAAFNGKYGGKQFIITSTGKLTDEPWKAATRSTVWTVPKVDHTRFLPMEEPFSTVDDAMGRKGLNVFIPTKIKAVEADVSLWLDLLNKILPDPNDQKLLTEYMAHCVKYPGYKIQYAPLLQSAEGIGKSIFCDVMSYSLGDMYVYSPKATELVSSGSTFNAWQRGKLLITVNEIKIDERRELIEILKPMITDSRVEIQSKGVDQEMEDNAANWFFFSNYKDAIPINKDNRRYSIFYSALQSSKDIENAGMGKDYFDRIFDWLQNNGGREAIAYWLLNYPIEKGSLPVRAPKTSSYEEALRISRSPMEIMIAEAVEDGIPGFKGGFISSVAALKKCKMSGLRHPNGLSIQKCLESMGYVALGRSVRPYVQEDVDNRTQLYGNASNLRVKDFGKAQGYD